LGVLTCKVEATLVPLEVLEMMYCLEYILQKYAAFFMTFMSNKEVVM
jgi:hypothetical protein